MTLGPRYFNFTPKYALSTCLWIQLFDCSKLNVPIPVFAFPVFSYQVNFYLWKCCLLCVFFFWLLQAALTEPRDHLSFTGFLQVTKVFLLWVFAYLHIFTQRKHYGPVMSNRPSAHLFVLIIHRTDLAQNWRVESGNSVILTSLSLPPRYKHGWFHGSTRLRVQYLAFIFFYSYWVLFCGFILKNLRHTPAFWCAPPFIFFTYRLDRSASQHMGYTSISLRYSPYWAHLFFILLSKPPVMGARPFLDYSMRVMPAVLCTT